MKVFHLIVPLVFLAACVSSSYETKDFSKYSPLRSGFENPGGTARAKVYWWWLNGHADTARIRTELKAIKEAGLGGVDIFEIGFRPEGALPPGPAFLSNESLKIIEFAIREATRLDLEVGLNLASSWNAGGTWITPEHSAKSLYRSTVKTSGGQNNIRIPFPAIEKTDSRGKRRFIEFAGDGRPVIRQEVAVLAIPAGDEGTYLDTTTIINVTRYLDARADVLNWEVPPGEWEIHRYVCSSSGEALKLPSPNSTGPIIDHFDSAATRFHFNYVIDRLRSALGDFGDTALKNLYLASFEATGTVWTPTLAETFKKIHGYSPDKFLPQLFGTEKFDSATAREFKRDFDLVLSELMINNHYRKGKEIANKHGLNLISEAGGPGPPLHNVPVEGIKALGSLDVPRGEFWINHSRPDGTADSVDLLMLVKEVSAAAHTYQRKIAELEAFTSFQSWQEGPGDMRPVGDRAFMEGMNRAVIHGFTHNPEGMGYPGIVYHAGTHYNDRTTWWPKSKPFNDYLARISYILQETQFVADVLYYYGDRVPNFVVPRNTRFAVGSGYDYEVVNTEILLRDVTVDDGLVTMPYGARFKVLALGEIETLDSALYNKLRRLAENGAIITGKRPKVSQENERLISELWDGGLIETTSTLQILGSAGVRPDFDYPDKGSERLDYQHKDKPVLEYAHYRYGSLDFYFVRNTRDARVSRLCNFRQENKTPEIWDPVSGRVFSLPIYNDSDGVITIPLTFEPHGSYFVVFKQNNGEEHYTAIKSSGHPPVLDHTSAGIRFMQAGSYTLLTDGKETTYTQRADSVILDGEWQVSFDPQWGGPGSVTFPALSSWPSSNNEGIRYYSGAATYDKTFTFGKKDGDIYLDLGDVAEVADVWLNDRHLGITWTKPFRYNITGIIREGANELRIEVVNTWSNRIVGDLSSEQKFTNTNVQRGANGRSWSETPLLTSGLLGPVKITVVQSDLK